MIVVVRSATPALSLTSPVTYIGQATPVQVRVHDPRGIRKAAAYLEQNGAQYAIWTIAQPLDAADNTFSFTAGVKTTPQLKDGAAKLIVEATSNDLLRKSARLERDVTVVTRPPGHHGRQRPALSLPRHG